ncbi:MAG TPA: 2-amino-4-hydroxy-6-hydroxymethyldihydropteridine diphosphokinase [Aliidongia sp.]|uniref:2-amino-4-hydroxy-6- hydroxymethyldihydropteridine diphosphokinase n=1 Tax=Aliidongia sp. TaxID=1914230 RepID=UPI002DDDAB9B|nr:2-amino-4-hydroxy-6-hydroxymethyldihydropteridine diphosphokinase [Aliidongia sp.]HEV2678031.1 2-amino-4-hydroxy-6-hydroxymethyldihydropteridine diphosphokinase [Aliidongia sp.]
MIYVALGANLPSPIHGLPRATLEAALGALGQSGLRVAARSAWYETAPVPVSDQPWYVNGVARIETMLGPADLLECLHRIEAAFGRVREVVNAPRVLDLDLLACGDMISVGWPLLPHPRLHERAFVLRPLADVAPGWRHPLLGLDIAAMLAAIGPEQTTRPLV